MFKLIRTENGARRGEFCTAHQTVQTPVFMNVGTAAAIRGGVSPDDLKEIGCQMALCNGYHLHLRPGEDLIAQLGGLHRFMNWDAPLLTDSGGFQVFSLGNRRSVTEDGVAFSSYVDGRKILMTPEESMRIQAKLGADVAMAFDECVSLPCEYAYAKESALRTARWLGRCREAHEILKETEPLCQRQLLFGINQGATFPDLRKDHMRQIAELDLDGYAIGGLSVGETAEEMYGVIAETEPYMPKNKPRYLMGVGTPQNILEAVRLGIDFFDCVLPQRTAQHGNVFTMTGKMRLLAERYRYDERPIDENCACPACRRYSRAYIRHLIKADERLGMRLCVLHNLYFYNRFTHCIRTALDEGIFEAFYRENREALGTMREN